MTLKGPSPGLRPRTKAMGMRSMAPGLMLSGEGSMHGAPMTPPQLHEGSDYGSIGKKNSPMRRLQIPLRVETKHVSGMFSVESHASPEPKATDVQTFIDNFRAAAPSISKTPGRRPMTRQAYDRTRAKFAERALVNPLERSYASSLAARRMTQTTLAKRKWSKLA